MWPAPACHCPRLSAWGSSLTPSTQGSMWDSPRVRDTIILLNNPTPTPPLPISIPSLASLGLWGARNNGFTWPQSHSVFPDFWKQNSKAWLSTSLSCSMAGDNGLLSSPELEEKISDWRMEVGKTYYIKITAHYTTENPFPLSPRKTPPALLPEITPPLHSPHGFAGCSGYNFGYARNTISFLFLCSGN